MTNLKDQVLNKQLESYITGCLKGIAQKSGRKVSRKELNYYRDYILRVLNGEIDPDAPVIPYKSRKETVQ